MSGASLDPSFDALLRACAASRGRAEGAGWVVPQELADRFEARRRAAGGRVSAAGGWRAGLCRPFDGLAELVDQLATRLNAGHPELLQRYNLALVSVAPAWRETELLRQTRVLSSGLADFALRGDSTRLKDFYWKSDNAPKIIADLVHLVIDGATALAEEAGDGPVVLRLDGLERAERAALDAVALLGDYAREAPLVLVAGVPAGDAARLAGRLGGWRVLASDDAPAAGDREGPWAAPGGAAALLDVASVLARPFAVPGLRALSDEAGAAWSEPDLKRLVEQGVLRPLVEGTFTFAAAAARDRAYRDLDPGLRRRLHRAALELERHDPFAASWHAWAGGLGEEAADLHEKALDAAWAVSDHASALELATRLLAATADRGRPDGGLLLAMLHYDGGRGHEADERLRAVLDRRSHDPAQRTLLTHLTGYNKVFGCGDFDGGRQLLEEVLEVRRHEQREEEAGFIRNTIAYALFRSGCLDEAVAMEREALAALERAGAPAGFLSSILQLNLGRLQRNLGQPDRALELLARALADQSWDVSPYMLLIFDSARALLHTARGEHEKALAAYHHALGLVRDLKREYAGSPVSTALVQSSGVPFTGRLTRGDEILFQLFLNLALCCRRLGLEGPARTFVEGLRALWSFLPAEVWATVGTAWDTANATPGRRNADPAAGFEEEAVRAVGRSAGLAREIEVAGPVAARLAADLTAGQAIAVVRPQPWGAGVRLIESLVLYDPRCPDIARRINAEIGSTSLPRARSALVLDDDAGLFPPLRADLPGLLQQVRLEVALRPRLPALEPVRLEAQVIGSDEGFFASLLREVRRVSGIGVLAAIPFHLRGRDLALAPGEALQSFLLSSLDALLLGDRLLEKTHGAAAAENLLPFRPRLSRHAALHEERDGEAGGLIVQVRIASYKSEFLRLRRELKPLLALCDGQHSVAEILEELGPRWGGGADVRAPACDLLRRLWRRGAIGFETSPADRRAHASL